MFYCSFLPFFLPIYHKVTPNNGNKVAPAGVILTVADLEVDSVWVHDEHHNMYELQYDAFNFSPAIDDNIRVLNELRTH